MPILASLLAAVIPMVGYLFIIWRMDKYDREPLNFVLLHFFWGAFGAIFLGIMGSLLLSGFASFTTGTMMEDSLIETILFAPFSEEIAKGLFLIWSVNSTKFDNITDGLVYGSAIGLGFGMTENFTYFIAYGDSPESWLFLVIVRSGFSAVMHCIASGTFGAYLGIFKFSRSPFKRLLPIAGLANAIFIHFLWNYSVSFSETYLLGFILMIFLTLFYFGLFRYSTHKEKRIIEFELADESLNHFFPPEHIGIISSNLRFRKGWIDEKIRRLYFRTAIRLAFSKMKSKNSSGYYKLYYENEILKHRKLISNLLNREAVQ